MEVAANCVVSIRYIMENEEGEVLENTMQGQPVAYLHGGTGILEILQRQLEGLKTGDKKTVHLSAEAGLTERSFIFEVIVDDVHAASSEELLLGYPVQLPVTLCDADCDCYTEVHQHKNVQ
ncbi:FKBP-type peptidyl-prolyl cis-trans isomerase [Ferruginibacter paludis]|uniref:FKBP-type peptidyl-prolyl cis-trans isomerase n=1 Tax=Ferruginibacter paludis TaxID=1310417 RepID=UPI0025B59FB6|nr:FKBP-type peptidyl-prolyl cis-trans isomerase [Ferruginibacter paludis]MDN3655477.1 FKBP-type peptidyl-prolyl cis-trans isomerase [Ferruginibacter paludis]